LELCEEQNLDATAFARLIGISDQIAQMLFDHEADAAITPAIAERLGPVSRLPVSVWLRWEANYRACFADKAERAQAGKVA
jgi:plasmid maintenance system antidote protein VapI